MVGREDSGGVASRGPRPGGHRRRAGRGAVAGWALALVTVCLAFGVPAASAAEDGDGARDRRLLDTYRSMLADDPDQDYALRRMLEVSHAVGGLTGLVALYEEELEADPRAYSAWLVLGHLQRAADNEARALAAYARAAELRPQAHGPWLARAVVHRRARRWEEALIAYDGAIERARELTTRQEALRDAAETAVEAEQPDRADAFFDRLVATEPRNVFLRMQRAATLARLGQRERALAAWQDVEERARGRLEHLVIIWKEIAELQVALGDLEAAEATWRRALERTPRSHWERRTFLEGLIAVHRRSDRLGELIAELEPDASNNHELLVTLARLHEELADDAAALARYREALRIAPRDVETRLATLRILERTASADEVIAAWAALVAAVPGEPRFELRLAELYLQHGKREQGYALIARISRRYPSDPGVHQQVIDLWTRFGDASTRRHIEREYKILQRLEPDDETHVVSLGEYYWSVDDRERALATWRRLLTMGASPAEGHFLLAEVYVDHDLFDQARAEFGRAIALAPDEPRYARAYALLLERKDQPVEALEVWQALLEAGEPDRATQREARRHVIELWERTRRVDAEVAGLERAFAEDPPDRDAGSLLADTFVHLRRLADARRVLERLLALDPDSVDALVGLEAVYRRVGEHELAIDALERLARVDSRSAGDYLQRAADVALGLGEDRRALGLVRQVLELNPADASAHARAGDLYARMGYRAEAGDAWRQSLALDPRRDEVRFKLAALYRQTGQQSREEQLLVEVLRDGRDPSDALIAGRRLLALAASSDRLPAVEEVLATLALSRPNRGVFLRLLVDALASQASQLVHAPLPAEDRRAALATLGERGLKPLLDALVDADVSVRSRALDVLEVTHPPGATFALARLLNDEDVLGQLQAAVALGRIGSEAAAAALGRMAHRRAPARDVAVWALGLNPSADAARALTERLATAQVRERPLIAAALGYGRHREGVAAATKLAGDRSGDVRLAGIWALGRIALPEVTPLLGHFVHNGVGPEPGVAVWGLARVDTEAAHGALITALHTASADHEDAIWLALGAGAVDDERRTAAAYERLLQRDRGFVAPPRRALFVGALRAPAAAETPVVRRFARPLSEHVGVLLHRRDPPLTARLLAALTRGEALSLVPPGLFPADAEANAEATREVLAPWLDQLLALAAGDASGDEVGFALEVSGRLCDAAQRDPTFATRWGDRASSLLDIARVAAAARDLRTRIGALEAIARCARGGDPSLGDAVRGALDEADADPGADALRHAATRALARLEVGAADPVWLTLLRDRSPRVRAAAAAGLSGPLGDPVVSALADLLEDPSVEVALHAVRTLAASPQPRARQALEAAAVVGQPRVRQAAREAIAAGGAL